MNPTACFSIHSEDAFNKQALELFYYQSESVAVYRDYLKMLKINTREINSWSEIPCLPIQFFKSHKVLAENEKTSFVFESSGTTGSINSKHFVADKSLYEQSFTNGFELFYGDVKKYCVLALLPSYLERNNSSLVYMADRLIKESQHPASGFYLDQYKELSLLLADLRKRKQATILIGVTYALLDLIEQYPLRFPELIIMETGGMKGRRKEMVREELHSSLMKGFSVKTIHSEYGMTELLSQAYSNGKGIFKCPPWMRIAIRDINDPLSQIPNAATGGINVIDLANVYSCGFIATQDLGKRNDDGSFEVIGRFDNSDLRGCNLLVSI
jgi:hypothetical protein